MKVSYFSVGALGTNCYIVSHNSRAAIIDPGGDAQRILNAVKCDNLTVDCILLTHAHFDHIMAVDELCEATGAPVYVGAGDAPMLYDANLNLSAMVYPEQRVERTPDRLLFEGDVVRVGDASLTVMETPGHTRGSVCYLGEDVLFSGDTLFAGSIGRTDLPGGDMVTLRRSLAQLASLDGDFTVYSGHGEETTLSYEKAANPYLAF